jgi:uncharacterized membrane protein
MLPRADVIELEMSVDEALTYVISMGSVAPAATRPGGPPRPSCLKTHFRNPLSQGAA